MSTLRMQPTTAPSDPATVDTVAALREVQPYGGQLHVTGAVAIKSDLTERVADRMPWVIAVVVALSALLLLFAFRAPVLAVKAAVMNLLSVRTGLAATGRVITSAALIMVCVFASFVLNPSPVIKMFGLGMAVAIAVDATIIRGLLVPATMALLGRANWWRPGAGRPATGDIPAGTQRDGLLPAGEASRPLDAAAGLPFSTDGNPP
ncbi:MMPL family transporter [Micromonospora sp. Llam0]|uniref:MMPL family transporter n=1 Tax=Micromonospora sp. Llam0 TaxID=2485143 RepID=UPI001F31ADAA|nr:MMPL family transporter [Micromonospora sp. Llam0]